MVLEFRVQGCQGGFQISDFLEGIEGFAGLVSLKRRVWGSRSSGLFSKRRAWHSGILGA